MLNDENNIYKSIILLSTYSRKYPKSDLTKRGRGARNHNVNELAKEANIELEKGKQNETT